MGENALAIGFHGEGTGDRPDEPTPGLGFPLRARPRLRSMQVFAVLLVGYLLGSIDFGVVVARLKGFDIYAAGSGNPGASNVLRTLGKGPAAVVLVGDALKGVAAAALGRAVGGDVVAAAAGLAAVVGHVLPLWHRFRGGRGVATALGVALYLAPVAGVVLALLWVGIVAVWKVASIASLVAMMLYVPAMALAGHRDAALYLLALVVVVVVARHAPNIRRLLAGSERTVEG